MTGSSLLGMGGSIARLLLLPIALATAGVRDLPAGDKKEEKAKVALPPELEEKLADFLKKATEAKRKVWKTRMRKEIERLVKTTASGEEAARALETPADEASEACIEGWTAKLSESYRGYLSNYEEEMVDQILAAQVDQVAQSDWFGNYVRPFNHPKWEEGIQRILGAEKAAAWQKAETERNETVKKEVAEVLKVSVQNSGQQQLAMLLAKGAVIKSLLSLPKERGDKLEALAKSIADTGAEKFRLRAEELLLAMDEPERKQVLKTKQFNVGEEPKYAEAQLTAWKEAVAGVLLADEEKRLKETRENSMARRVVVMGKIMITLLDDRVAFTGSQRERLQPIAERLVKDQKALFDEANLQNYYRLNAQAFFTAGAKATEEELKPILDPQQWKHWKDACLQKNYLPNQNVIGGMVVIRKSEPAGGAKPPAAAPEPEDLENALSDYFHTKTVNERKQLLAVNLLKAEDAARVAGLAPEALARLETAARGITEVALAAWKTNTDQTIRSQLQDATPENIRQRLAGFGTYSYQRIIAPGSAEAPIWDKTVKTELTEPQQAAWKKELDSRTAYRNKAIAALVMAEFDRKISLTAEQWTKLEPIIAGKVKDYAPDIESMFSTSYPYSWFLQSYTMFIPIAAIPEEDLKAILSKEQWDSWKGSPEMENTNNYWENVQNRHGQRVKEEKK